MEDKKALKIQTQVARQQADAHISGLTGQDLTKAYRKYAKAAQKKEITIEKKRKEVAAIISELPESLINELYKNYCKTGLTEEAMIKALKTTFKKAEANTIWGFIADTMPTKTRKAKVQVCAPTEEAADEAKEI